MVSVPFRAAADAARVDLSRAPQGLYDPEVDAEGRSFRWSGDRTVLYVPTSARSLQWSLRSLAPFPQKVVVLQNGVVVDELKLVDHSWREFRYVLPDRASSQRFHRFELQVSPTWVPPDDTRELGVVVGDWSWK
jgi:hypothetical protein